MNIKFKIPEGFICANDYLKYTAFEGITRRYPKEKEAGDDKWKNIIEKLEYELEIIAKGGFQIISWLPLILLTGQEKTIFPSVWEWALCKVP